MVDCSNLFVNQNIFSSEYGCAYHVLFLAVKHDQKTLSTMFSIQRVV